MSSPNKPRHTILILLVACSLIFGATGLVLAKAGKRQMAAQDQMEAFQVYQQKCLSCHDSIADPESPGKTRDGWTIVVKYMNDHYVQLTDQQANQIINLLYAIRRGLEKEPG
ncbi:MAG: hypothetical protein KQI62_10890 [Deltaproteobacteria bacterium]|nr:hypothetical protein [Deltaproteobacteria bacterium]